MRNPTQPVLDLLLKLLELALTHNIAAKELQKDSRLTCEI